MNEKICGIYCISNSKYFYIGLSSNIRSRWCAHRNALKKGTHYNYIMQSVYNQYYISDPFEYSIICECEPKDLSTLEIKYFEEYKIKYSGKKIPMNIANCGGFCIWTEPMRKKASKTHTGMKKTPEQCKAISERQLGTKRPKQQIKVVQLTLEGQVLKIWDSVVEASQTLHIKIQFNRKSSGGFQWQKYSDWLKNPKGPVEYHRTKEILQYSKTGQFIAKYNSIQEASDLTGIRHCNISNTLTGIQKSAGGYIWKYQK